MPEGCVVGSKVIRRLEELATKDTLSESEQKQFETLTQLAKTVAEQKSKQEELKNAKVNRYWDVGSKVFLGVASLTVTVCLFKVGYCFETTSAWTSKTAQVVKNLLNIAK